MLDGLVIKENGFERGQKEPQKTIGLFLKKHYVAFIISVLIHVFLFITLFLIAEKHPPKQVEITPKAIKSYLYKLPPKKIEIKAEVEKQMIEDVVVEEAIAVKENSIIDKIIDKQSSREAVNPKPTKEPIQTEQSTSVQKPMNAKFSAFKQLNNLRNSINEKMMARDLADLQQVRSPSIMHGKQTPVPHSTVQLTPEQEREKRITKMSDDISITKYDNGVCTIERKQFLGSPVEGSVSAFACGESKFDKSFRDHMKRVRDKAMPINNK